MWVSLACTWKFKCQKGRQAGILLQGRGAQAHRRTRCSPKGRQEEGGVRASGEEDRRQDPGCGAARDRKGVQGLSVPGESQVGGFLLNGMRRQRPGFCGSGEDGKGNGERKSQPERPERKVI